ncbi:unnamed protein product [Musa textilis]
MDVHVLRREERGIEGVWVAHPKRFFLPMPHNCRLSRFYPSIHYALVSIIFNLASGLSQI